GETEQRECLVAGALGWQEVAMVSAAMQIDQFHPAAGKAVEGTELGPVDRGFKDTGDHRGRANPRRSTDTRLPIGWAATGGGVGHQAPEIPAWAMPVKGWPRRGDVPAPGGPGAAIRG